MPDLPRDPRQLARDILAGKISIEQLAREQQRRLANKIPPPGQQRPPQRIPLPRPVPPPRQPTFASPTLPPPVQRPPQRPVVQRPVLRPVARPAPTRTAPPRGSPQRQPAPAPSGRPPIRHLAAAAPVQRPQQQATTAQARGNVESQTAGNRAKPVQAEKKLGVRRLLASRNAVRQGIVMSEILGPPVGLREW